MASEKIKVLFVTENPMLSTGFATLGRQILSRLATAPELELAVLSCSGQFGDDSFLDLPYKVYQNVPNPKNQDEIRAYLSQPVNEFGRFKFDEVCLDFKPDIVCAFRDAINDGFLEGAPYRRFYSLILMSSCDAAPRHHEEIQLYSRADGLLTYSEFGAETLSKQIENFGEFYQGMAPPAADYDVFKPHLDKSGLKASLGLGGKIVIGTVNRNQPRKMFPALIEAFALLLERAPDSIKDKLALYLHTGYPDAGWNLPSLLLNAGIASKTYLTYSCSSCKEVSPSTYRGIISQCPACGSVSYKTASSDQGVSREVLAGVYNLFDVYTQFATCEGFGMGAPEAASCGVPCVMIDYSAMSDIGRTINAQLIQPDAMRLEEGIERKLACVSPESMCEALLVEVMKPGPLREFEGGRAARLVRETYNYDKSAQSWLNAIVNVYNNKKRDRWDAPKRIIEEELPPLKDFALVKYLAAAMTPESRVLSGKLLSHFTDSMALGGDNAKNGIWQEAKGRIAHYNTKERERCMLL